MSELPKPIQFIDLPYQMDSSVYFHRLLQLDRPVWLDSGMPESSMGRYDILSACPVELLKNPDPKVIEDRVSKLKQHTDLESAKNFNLPFLGGAIGYFNYEYNYNDYNLNAAQNYSEKSIFGIFDWALIQDHQQKQSYLVFLPSCDREKKAFIQKTIESEKRSIDKINACHEESLPFQVNDITADLSKEDYFSALDKIKNYILEGDTYQINFSQQFSGKFSGHPAGAYLALRKAIPSPYSAYLALDDTQRVLSISPERFVSVNNRKATTQPIKGTAPRSQDKPTDEQLAKALLNSDKNRAENLMIVDLLRNDFSKSCKPFSVKVDKLFELQSFTNVHHLVSTITGDLEDAVSPLQFFMNCFPGGSITGAPKKRAMEIIRELEQHSRNIYCGSITYLGINDRLDSNIGIRTLLIEDDSIFCWGGGGIVADSTHNEEYEESIHKIQRLLDTLTSKH